MRTLTITQLLRGKQENFKRIPPDGILITRNKKAIAIIKRPDRKKISIEVGEIAEKSIREIQVDTFNKVEVKKTETTLGTCSRCGIQGEVIKGGYMNNYGVIVGKYLCTTRCYVENRQASKRKPLVLIDKKELTVSHGDFGGANEKKTF